MSGKAKYKNTEFMSWHFLMRVNVASARQIVDVMVDSGCGYLAPSAQVLASKLRVWGYNCNHPGGRRGGGSFWCIGPKTEEPEMPRTLPKRFLEYLDRAFPLNN